MERAAAPKSGFGGKMEVFLLVAVGVTLALGMDPALRTFWPYMLSAYLMGVAVYLHEFRSVAGKPRLLDYLFPREIWLHHSSLTDCAIVAVNTYLMKVTGNYIAVLNPDKAMALFKQTLHYTEPSVVVTPSTAALVFYTFFAAAMAELFYYINHRIMHEIPALWEFHKVHHSAKVLTPLTILRLHPVEAWLLIAVNTVGFGLTSMVFLHFYPGGRNVIEVAGINAFVIVFNFLGSNLRHSHIWISFGPVVNRFFMSPAQHQIHHSDAPRHFNKNYGSQFSFWDWIFGSLYVPAEREHLTFGLGSAKAEKPYQTLWSLYTHPIKNLFVRKRPKVL